MGAGCHGVEGVRILYQHVAQGHVAAALGLVADGVFFLPRFSAWMTTSVIVVLVHGFDGFHGFL